MTKILVTGATGNVGRELVAQLPPESVRAFSRQSGGDLSRPATLQEPLADVDAVFLIWPFLSADAAPAVLEMIGGRRIVYLSSSGSPRGNSDPINQLHGELEELIAKYTTDLTVLRSNTIASNAAAGPVRSAPVTSSGDPTFRLRRSFSAE